MGPITNGMIEFFKRSTFPLTRCFGYTRATIIKHAAQQAIGLAKNVRAYRHSESVYNFKRQTLDNTLIKTLIPHRTVLHDLEAQLCRLQIKNNPQDTDALFRLAVLLHTSKVKPIVADLEGTLVHITDSPRRIAAVFYRRILKLAPRHHQATINLATCLYDPSVAPEREDLRYTSGFLFDDRLKNNFTVFAAFNKDRSEIIDALQARAAAIADYPPKAFSPGFGLYLERNLRTTMNKAQLTQRDWYEIDSYEEYKYRMGL